jgi:hypothetical protein
MVIGRGRGREHPQPTFCNTTKGEKRRKKRTCAEHTSGFTSLPVKRSH